MTKSHSNFYTHTHTHSHTSAHAHTRSPYFLLLFHPFTFFLLLSLQFYSATLFVFFQRSPPVSFLSVSFFKGKFKIQKHAGKKAGLKGSKTYFHDCSLSKKTQLYSFLTGFSFQHAKKYLGCKTTNSENRFSTK